MIVQVTEVDGTEVICIANNDAVLGGLLTVYHVERSTGSLENVQNDLPVRPGLTARKNLLNTDEIVKTGSGSKRNLFTGPCFNEMVRYLLR